MKINVSKPIGNSTLNIEIDDRDEKVALGKATVFLQKDVCGLCHSEDITWVSNKAEDDKGGVFIYVKRRCNKCNAASNLGTYQGNLGYFWNKWEVFVPNTTKQV